METWMLNTILITIFLFSIIVGIGLLLLSAIYTNIWFFLLTIMPIMLIVGVVQYTTHKLKWNWA